MKSSFVYLQRPQAWSMALPTKRMRARYRACLQIFSSSPPNWRHDLISTVSDMTSDLSQLNLVFLLSAHWRVKYHSPLKQRSWDRPRRQCGYDQVGNYILSTESYRGKNLQECHVQHSFLIQLFFWVEVKQIFNVSSFESYTRDFLASHRSLQEN